MYELIFKDGKPFGRTLNPYQVPTGKIRFRSPKLFDTLRKQWKRGEINRKEFVVKLDEFTFVINPAEGNGYKEPTLCFPTTVKTQGEIFQADLIDQYLVNLKN